ncbi:MAG: TRAP transporter large permease [Rhodothalassiaceae bacterium]
MSGAVLSLLLLLVLLLAGGLWVGLALIAVGLAALLLLRDVDALAFLAGDVWRSLTAPELVALPLFVLMGEILNRSRVAERLFAGLAPWLAGLPGGLVHTNIAGCTLFAAVSGSSAATTATVGRITLPELRARGHDERLVIGSLCGAGTLGFLIPPSIVLILYGVLAEVSIVTLFLAGIVPGLLLAGGYMAYVAIVGPRPPAAAFTWRERLRALPGLLPVLALILVVVGSMYAGIAGPTEAATIGVGGALLVAAMQRTLDIAALRAALLAGVRTSAMLGLILAGAFFLSKVAALFGLPEAAARAVGALTLPPPLLILALLLLYVLLGMVLDGLSLILMTLPVTLPLATGAGFDPVWFGIFLVIVVEMAQITPPVGFNLFVVQDLSGRPLGSVARAAFPFFLITAAMVLLLLSAPGIVLWVNGH